MYTPLWLTWIYFSIALIVSAWLFLQGYQNVKSGRVTGFGFDALLRLMDRWTKNKRARWEEPRRIRVTGFIALFLALEAIFCSALLLFQVILPRLS